jgi:hypothetical protein
MVWRMNLGFWGWIGRALGLLIGDELPRPGWMVDVRLVVGGLMVLLG